MKETQLKITHNCIVLNDALKEWELLMINKCTFCHNHREKLKHILLDCNITKLFWNWILVNRNIRITLDEKFMYFNGFNNLSEANFLITLCAKFAVIIKSRNVMEQYKFTRMNPVGTQKTTFNCAPRSTLELHITPGKTHKTNLFGIVLREWNNSHRWDFIVKLCTRNVKQNRGQEKKKVLVEKKGKRKNSIFALGGLLPYCNFVNYEV